MIVATPDDLQDTRHENRQDPRSSLARSIQCYLFQCYLIDNFLAQQCSNGILGHCHVSYAVDT